MNLIYGTPSEFSTSLKFEASWDYCISYCYQMSTCLAAYYQEEFPEICEIFEIGNLAKIQKLNAYSGKFMAVKTTSPSECSVSSNDSLMSGTVSTESTWQNYSIQVSPDFWIIDSSPFFKCPENFKLWQRTKGLWCMGVVPTGEITRLDAQKMCAENFQGVLSGFDSDFEHTSAIKAAVPLVPKSTPYKYYGYYMDGERKTNCRYLNQTGPDCNGNKGFLFSDRFVTTYDHYLWGFDNQPNGMSDNLGTSNCVAMRVNSKDGAGLDDLPCNGSTSTIFMNGFICGFPPNFEI
ncbi:hypothetical protein B9Z55_003311 [Caenorhabditis nigoni]|uniref:PAN-3 domain-containing protein n=2 Tax=Caenorhabditis nigoni TaxID=1611254 RepID=A0A2G5VPY6_9PELO|nr:hypothetical protein B9Z55_003311 [Caenorhabditis nigoni]